MAGRLCDHYLSMLEDDLTGAIESYLKWRETKDPKYWDKFEEVMKSFKRNIREAMYYCSRP